MIVFDERLKSCPLCGGKAYLRLKSDLLKIVTVACTKCNLNTSIVFLNSVIEIEQQAIEKWNCRVGNSDE